MPEALMLAFNKKIATEFDEKLKRRNLPAHEPTPQQSAFLSAFHEQSSSLLGEAVAGSGKTHLLLSAALSVPFDWTCKTLHGLGYSAWRDKIGRNLRVEDSKLFQTLKELSLDDLSFDDFGDVLKLAKLAKTFGIVPRDASRGTSLIPDEESVWEELAEMYDYEYSPYMLPFVRILLNKSIALAFEGRVDFDDMLYMPVCFHGVFPKFPLIVGDEVQDWSAIQHEMVKRIRERDGIVVCAGDRSQCNPPGTQVLTPEGNVPIETLRAGDEVIVFHRDKRHMRPRKVLTVASRHYNGRLIEITTRRGSYAATPNHLCVARLSPRVEDWEAVYLMRKGKSFRMGKTVLRRRNEKEFGLALRMRQEGADAIWLISAFESKEEALMFEQIWSADFGIPTICFKNSGTLAISQHRLDLMWSIFGDNSERGHAILAAFNLDPQFPIASKTSKEQIAFSRRCMIRAVNLSSDLFDVPFPSEEGLAWEVASISSVEYEGIVHSLEVEANQSTNDRGLYIANGILTGNSIYGFRGALADSIPALIQDFSMQLLPLTVSFRCPKAVVAEAQRDVPHIEAAPSAIEGEVIRHGAEAPLSLATVPRVVLCRNTAPIVQLAMRLIAEGRGATIAGRDIGKSLIRLVRKIASKTMTIEAFEPRLASFIEKEIQRRPASEARFRDKQAALVAICTRADALSGGQTTTDSVIKIIEQLYSDSRSGVLLSTIHRAKGLEWPDVLILDPFLMPSKYATQDWQLQQERNVRYVAVTRAQQTLHFAESEEII